MFRLYIKHYSDLRAGTGHGASKVAKAEIRWGSAKDSKLACSIEVLWKEGEPAPLVYIKKGWDGITFIQD